MIDLRQLEEYFDRLWPICRSITGEGYRRSLDIVSEVVPTERLRFPTGQSVFDWTVPDEWNVRDAYLVDPHGARRAEFSRNNLHLLNYSAPFRGEMSLEELRPHLYSLPDQPDAIPYLTSYYKERWGFCLTHRELESLPAGRYGVVVDTELKPGRVEIGETVLPGESPKEVLFSTYLCHPSLANNELSGPLVMMLLYEKIKAMPKRRFTYRFAVMPETIGSICYLSVRGEHLKKNLVAGYQITCAGDPGPFTYKPSRRGDSPADAAARAVLTGRAHRLVPFTPAAGSDERQYCSPGFDLPVGSLMRTMYACYKEYHTSLDDKSFVSFPAMMETADVYAEIVRLIEGLRLYRNRVAFCEPQLGKRGLYPALGSQKVIEDEVAAIMWVLNFSDGRRDLRAIAEKSGLSAELLAATAEKLETKGLLEREA